MPWLSYPLFFVLSWLTVPYCWGQFVMLESAQVQNHTTANIATDIVATDVPFEHLYFNWPSEGKALSSLLLTYMEAGQEVPAPSPSPKFGSPLSPPC